MMRDADGRVTRIPAYFCALPQIVNEGQPLNLGEILASLNQQIDDFNKRGSGFELETIDKVILAMSPFLPLCGSTYIPTPTFLKNKHCLVNVQNRNDSKCFLWSVLSAIHRADHNPHCLSHYKAYANTLNLKDLVFPITTKQIPTFERNNENISVNVYYDRDSGGFTIE